MADLPEDINEPLHIEINVEKAIGLYTDICAGVPEEEIVRKHFDGDTDAYLVARHLIEEAARQDGVKLDG